MIIRVVRPPSLLTSLKGSKGESFQLRSRRTFIAPPVQRITAQRTLPYPSLPIYQIIAAVPEYASFLPYCISSRVTRWSHPDPIYGQQWPDEAELEIGWGAVRERFKSRIYCVPDRVVEAVGGGAKTTLNDGDVSHHKRQSNVDDAAATQNILTHLLTRWTITPIPKGTGNLTEVGLDIEFQFSNPVYAAMSSAVANGVAEVMIEAFEARVKNELHENIEGNGRVRKLRNSN
jgi:coenzyme Q-binding protein COQ10